MDFPNGLPSYTQSDGKISNILTFDNLDEIEPNQKVVNRLFYIKSENIYYRYDTDTDTMVHAIASLNAGLGLNITENIVELNPNIYDMQTTKQNNLIPDNNIQLIGNNISTVTNPTFTKVKLTTFDFANDEAVTKQYVDNSIAPKRNGIYQIGASYTFPFFVTNVTSGQKTVVDYVNGYFSFDSDGFCHVSFVDQIYINADPSPNSYVSFNLPFEMYQGFEPVGVQPFGSPTPYYTQLINNGYLSGTEHISINSFIIDNTKSVNSMLAYCVSPDYYNADLSLACVMTSQIYQLGVAIRYSYCYLPRYPLIPVTAD